jgi:hypothetical protein
MRASSATTQRHARGGGHPRHHAVATQRVAWIPAFAGMTSRLMGCVQVLATAGLISIAVAQSPEVVFDLKVEKGKVAPNMRLIRVKQGDAVRLRWTTDRPIVLHLHGYDIETKVEPGAVTEMAFTAHATGRFPVEEHKANAKGGHSHGEAPLVRVEVRPR